MFIYFLFIKSKNSKYKSFFWSQILLVNTLWNCLKLEWKNLYYDSVSVIYSWVKSSWGSDYWIPSILYIFKSIFLLLKWGLIIHPSVTPDAINALKNTWNSIDLKSPFSIPSMYIVPLLIDLAAICISA